MTVGCTKDVTFEHTIQARFNKLKRIRLENMKIICEHPTCDNEVMYKHRFEDLSFSVQSWYDGDYCAEHMVEHLEHCISIIGKPAPIEPEEK